MKTKLFTLMTMALSIFIMACGDEPESVINNGGVNPSPYYGGCAGAPAGYQIGTGYLNGSGPNNVSIQLQLFSNAQNPASLSRVDGIVARGTITLPFITNYGISQTSFCVGSSTASGYFDKGYNIGTIYGVTLYSAQLSSPVYGNNCQYGQYGCYNQPFVIRVVLNGTQVQNSTQRIQAGMEIHFDYHQMLEGGFGGFYGMN